MEVEVEVETRLRLRLREPMAPRLQFTLSEAERQEGEEAERQEEEEEAERQEEGGDRLLWYCAAVSNYYCHDYLSAL